MAELRVWMEDARSAPMHSLVDLNLVGEQFLARFPANTDAKSREFEHLLVDAGLVSALDMEHARSHMLNTPEVDASVFQVEATALERLSWPLAYQHQVLPLGLDGGVLYVASATPFLRTLELRVAVLPTHDNLEDVVMRHQIQSRAPTSDFFAEASRAGMRTLRQDALEKVVAGVIDLKQPRSVYA